MGLVELWLPGARALGAKRNDYFHVAASVGSSSSGLYLLVFYLLVAAFLSANAPFIKIALAVA